MFEKRYSIILSLSSFLYYMNYCNTYRTYYSWYQLLHLLTLSKNKKSNNNAKNIQAHWDILYELHFMERNYPVRDWHPIFLRKVLRALESAVINVDWRRGSRGGRETPPGFTRTIRLRPAVRAFAHLPVINLCRTIQRQRCITGSTAQVQRPCPSRGYFDRPQREYALLVPPAPSRAAPFVFWLAISIRLTLRSDPARFTTERLN